LASGSSKWWLTIVYGPSQEAEKSTFLIELHELWQVRSGPWMLAGDFNLIYRIGDKNNGRLNYRLMGQFHRFLDDAALQEVHLNNFFFTWSNEHAHPTLERIDRVFISNQWDAIFLDCELYSLPSLCSDHVPLLICTDSGHHAKRFYFWSFWMHLPGFLEDVQQAWHCALGNVSPFYKLDWLLCTMTRFLKSWSDQFVGSIWVQLKIAKEVVHHLEAIRNRRQLLDHEEELRK
jgi:uncharacterized protein (DUF1778 family)